MHTNVQSIRKRNIVPQLQDGEAAREDCAWAVEQFYATLYTFAYSLTGSESDAADLTQGTCQILLTNGEAILDARKVNIWLHTTLYQQFLGLRRRETRFRDRPVESEGCDLPTITATQIERLDSAFVVAALQQLEEKFRSALAMYYRREFSYEEMAEVLGLPTGKIMSRIQRGKQIFRKRLQSMVATVAHRPDGKAAPV